jgi:hypothetical protein
MTFKVPNKKIREKEKVVEDTLSMSYIKELNQSKGQYFFSPSTTSFFKSKYPQYALKKGNYAYFVTGETNPSQETKFTIRKINLETGDTSTEGEFFEYSSRWEAEKEMRKLLR